MSFARSAAVLPVPAAVGWVMQSAKAWVGVSVTTPVSSGRYRKSG
jgi:hypothetical protein